MLVILAQMIIMRKMGFIVKINGVIKLKVLKLGQSYLPLSIIDMKKAIKLVYLGKAEVIKEYNKFIKTPNNQFKIPAVIRLYNIFHRSKKLINFNRRNVYIRDRFVCQYCGNKFDEKDLTLDHIIPKSKGGLTTWENCVACCVNCNIKKKNKTLNEANMKLLELPIRPDWLPNISFKEIPEEWKDFC